MFRKSYGEVFAGDEHWNGLEVPDGERFAWDDDSTYVRLPPYFEDMPAEPAAVADVAGARVLALLGDSVTTDHISPAGSIKRDGPAGAYLQSLGVAPRDFNSYGSRRGNHEVMVRGTFANIRLRNQLAPGTEGGVTRHLPDGSASEQMSIYDAAMRYAPRASRWSSSAARSTARVPRATGPPRGRAARRARRHRRELRAHPSLEPRRHGRPAAAVPDGESAASLGLTGRRSSRSRVSPLRWPMAAVRRRGAGAAPTAKRVHARACGSTPRARRSTSATAGSFRTSCASCSPHDARRRGTGGLNPCSPICSTRAGPPAMRRRRRRVWREAAAAFAEEVQVDVVGTALAHMCTPSMAPATRLRACSLWDISTRSA